QGVDLVIGSIVSWTPLAADYTRFTRSRRSAFWGTSLGYFVPTLWCFGIGCLLVLARVMSAPGQPPAAAAPGRAGIRRPPPPPARPPRRPSAARGAPRRPARRLLPLPVARARRAALVDDPRRPHEPRPLRLDGLAAELRGGVRPDGRDPSVRFGACGR